MGRQWLFKLDQNPEGRGLRCDGDGLFLGRDALLARDECGNFAARPVAELRKILRRAYSDDTNWESCSRSVELVARALNKGDLARAMMTAVLMRLPDPGEPGDHANLDGALAKVGFNPDEPRDERGRWSKELARYKKLWAAIAALLYGKPQNATKKDGDLHELASRILRRYLAKRSDIREHYFNSRLRTISKGEIDSRVQPDEAVVTDKNVIEPYEVKSPSNTYGQLEDKYTNIRPIVGSRFTLAKPQIMTIEKLLAMPEAKEIAEEDAQVRAAIEQQKAIEQEELFEQMEEVVAEDTAGEE